MNEDMDYRIVTEGNGFVASSIDGTVEVRGADFTETIERLRMALIGISKEAAALLNMQK